MASPPLSSHGLLFIDEWISKFSFSMYAMTAEEWCAFRFSFAWHVPSVMHRISQAKYIVGGLY